MSEPEFTELMNFKNISFFKSAGLNVKAGGPEYGGNVGLASKSAHAAKKR
ncbi:hypothetical protein [Mucilaginibacter sp. 10B2]|nr:hypothetical protein [Mucilaginibacter sp. 10B2]